MRLERITEIVEGALPPEAELLDARISGGREPLLTLQIDRFDGPVDHEFCARIISEVSPVLEGEGFGGMLEVSSPGIERPLTKPEHFRRYAGRKARVRTVEKIGDRRNFTGVIERVTESGVVLRPLEGGAEVEIGFGSIARAHLKEEIEEA
ncbi:ribosome maturation factor RimP [Rubrobacter taiwanensis]|uniref:Ribosome maturation factor RimP n=1 Tax=Rubrobacter taiwanensis TaxID=185139 RepID=A0A4R1BHH5_9ACTN|nr:ribosome maturation factor RimP [Rubrobacter taiwanensis]TCJ16634.1 ribosome maturation factor RimP [Rubrobacter taiwanensis]